MDDDSIEYSPMQSKVRTKISFRKQVPSQPETIRRPQDASVVNSNTKAIFRSDFSSMVRQNISHLRSMPTRPAEIVPEIKNTEGDQNFQEEENKDEYEESNENTAPKKIPEIIGRKRNVVSLEDADLLRGRHKRQKIEHNVDENKPKKLKQAKLLTSDNSAQAKPNQFFVVEKEDPKNRAFVLPKKSGQVDEILLNPLNPVGPRLNNAHLLSVTDEVNEEDFVPAPNVSPKATLSIDAREVQSEDFEELARQTTATNQRMIFESTSQGHDDATIIDDVVAQPFVLNPGDQTIVQIPAFVNKNLRPYQRIGALFLYTLYRENRGGILADDMGLGKTIQAIAFISAIKGAKESQSAFFFNPKNKTGNKENSSREPSSDLFNEEMTENNPIVIDDSENEPITSSTKKTSISDKDYKGVTKQPVLIICPASVLENWNKEFSKWCRLRVMIFHGKDRSMALSLIKSEKLDVMLTSYETFRTNFNDINAIDWCCMLFDEVHKIKNKQSKLTQLCKKIKTRRRFGLTGTVMQNSFEELWTLIDFHCTGFLGSLDHFRKQYIGPIKNGHVHDATGGQIARGRIASKSLAEKLKRIILRRTKAIIANELPGKEDNVVFCAPTDVQLRCYKRVTESSDYQLLRRKCSPCECGSGQLAVQCCFKSDLTDGKNWKSIVLPAITRLQKLSNHLSLLVPKKTNEDANKIKGDLKFAKLAFGEDVNIIKDAIKNGNDTEICGKLRVLKSLLPIWREEGHKVLLFSYSTKMMDILARFLRRETFEFSRIDGNTPMAARQRLVDIFGKSRTQFVFLVSTKACGLGLNLTSANIVVIFDPNWNVTLDLQAQDRAYRIGQKKFTQIFRLVTAGTIEEMTYNRQIYKQQLANIGLHGNTERRYFKGVAGVKGQEGEIFGLANLFKLHTDSVLTNEIIERTERKEMFYKIAKTSSTADDNTNQVKNEGGEENELGSVIVSHDIDDDDGIEETRQELQAPSTQPSSAIRSHKDIEDVLRENGVVYSHLNTDVVGESEVEKQIAERALELETKAMMSNTFKNMFSSPSTSAVNNNTNSILTSPNVSNTSPTKSGFKLRFINIPQQIDSDDEEDGDFM
jgi:SNF2 family DNA or RNA helicase